MRLDKDIDWYMRGGIWTFPRLDGSEPIEHLKKIPTIRSKAKWQLRRYVGKYYISAINLHCLLYESFRVFVNRFPEFKISEIMNYLNLQMGAWELMVEDTTSHEWIDQIRFRYKHQVKKEFYEKIKELKEK